MLTLKDDVVEILSKQVHKFFGQDERRIKEHYPGITEKRLIEELESFLVAKCRDIFVYKDDTRCIEGSGYIQEFFSKLNDGVPLAYITGKSHFYNLEFVITPDVLIPRFETEILVEQALKELQKIIITDTKIRVADIGTGSGAIALSILQASAKSLSVVATDISEKALKVAKKNYFMLEFSIDPKSTFETVQTDKLRNVEGKFHLIVSNPPYIRAIEDRPFVHKNVIKFEPAVALFIEDAKYDDWFRELLFQVYNSLYAEGIFIMEGHEFHLDDLLELANEIGFTGSVLKDLTNRKRFLRLVKTKNEEVVDG